MKQKVVIRGRRGKKPPTRDKADQKLWHHFQTARKSERPVVRQGRELNDRGDDDERAWIKNL